LKIAVVRQRYNPYGGAERFVSRAASALVAQGASVTVVARDWSGAERQADWLRCDPFYLGRIWRDAGFEHAACRATADDRFDLVQSHERIACCDIYRAGDGVHAQWLQNRARMLSPLRASVSRWHPYHRYVLRAERRLFASARLRAVICNSRMVRDEIARWFGIGAARLHVIYNGVDLASFHPRLVAHRREVRAPLGIGDGERMVLFVGAGFERKGLPQLIRALAAADDRALHLLVVGKDRGERGLRRLAQRLGVGDRVHWPGPQRDVRPYYGAADCFALPTLYDPFPNAALEALASGLPVVTTAQCGAAELIEPGRSGFVCRDPADVAELAHNVRLAAAATPAMRAAARQAAEPCGLDTMAQRLLSLYKALIAKETGKSR
jgi:UDP-glucose:(heptosyl)LPS alpha-1,3-glucosyltransferase